MFLKWVISRPIFIYFSSFKKNSSQKNYERQQDSNSDRPNRCWPLYHLQAHKKPLPELMRLQIGPDCVKEDGAHDAEVGVRDSWVVMEPAQVEQIRFGLKNHIFWFMTKLLSWYFFTNFRLIN